MLLKFLPPHFEGLSSLSHSPYSLSFLGGFMVLLASSCLIYWRPNPVLERRLFWGVGFALILFTALRPIGLAIDDLAYVDISKNICAFTECFQFIHGTRDHLWYLLVALLHSIFSAERAILTLASLGLLMQLYIVDQLCKQKLLALTLFIVQVYLLFDFTIFRAGLAITIYFFSMYLLISHYQKLGIGLLAFNFLAHSQALFSIGLWPMHWIAKFQRLAKIIICLAVVAIYLKITPSAEFLSSLIYGAADKTSYIPQAYVAQATNSTLTVEKLFPLVDLLLLAYLGLLLSFDKRANVLNPEHSKISRYILASALLATMLSWFFATNHIVQTRLFDFYIAPIILLTGNQERNRWVFFLTLALAILIYVRMELIHNFILG